MPPKFKRNIQCILLKKQEKTIQTYIYGAITLYGADHSKPTSTYTKRVQKLASKTPHLPHLTTWDSVYPTPLSLAVTHDIAIAFSSTTY